MIRTIVVLVWLVGTLVRAVAAAPTLEDQTYTIARGLMCPVCAGQTVAESNAPLAQQMREVIRERLQRGETRQQILEFFVAQFGENVLAAPPKRGAGLVLWAAPVLAFVVGIAALTVYLRRMMRKPGAAVPPPPS